MLTAVLLATTLTFSGNFTQGGLVKIIAPENSKVSLDGKEIQGFGQKYFIGFGRDAALKSKLTITYSTGESEEYDLDITPQKYDIQNINKVSTSISNPTKNESAKIKEDALKIGVARAEADYTCPDNLEFVRPAPGLVTGFFGSQRIYNGVPGRPHSGVDFKGNEGDPAYAPEAGRVILTENMVLSGNTMAIDHGCGIVSTIMHLSAFEKKVGDIVQKGEEVGKIGKTGIATGPHLHWSLNLGKIRLDPRLLLK